MQGKDVILGLLNSKEMTGYEIKEIFESQLKYFFDGTFGMIYPILKKLERENLISNKRVFQTSKPNKNVYSITDKGRKEFQTYLISVPSEEVYKSDFLMRLYFGQDLGNDEVVDFITLEIKRKKSCLNELQENYEKWKEAGMDSLQAITFEYGISYYEGTLKVLEKALSKLK